MPRVLREYLEYQLAQYDDMVAMLNGEPQMINGQYCLFARRAVVATTKVLENCSDKVYEFARKTLLQPEGNIVDIAKEMGISRGRAIAWKSQIIYSVAASQGLVNANFTPSMVDEHPFSGRLYSIWAGMRQRCSNKEASGYKNYGGRGIKVCEEWQESYFNFERWARDNGYNNSLTIDRINNNGDYTPENCRWATKTQQQNNRRNNRLICVKGKKMTIAEAADKYGIPRSKAYQRINGGWTGDEMVSGKRVQKPHMYYRYTGSIESCQNKGDKPKAHKSPS